MPRVAFDLAEIAEEFMADFAGWYERSRQAKLEELFQAERKKSEADYLAGGRRFKSLSDKALKGRWKVALRRDLAANRRRRNVRDDLIAELSLRKRAGAAG
jgi:hypothetical protein